MLHQIDSLEKTNVILIDYVYGHCFVVLISSIPGWGLEMSLWHCLSKDHLDTFIKQNVI